MRHPLNAFKNLFFKPRAVPRLSALAALCVLCGCQTQPPVAELDGSSQNEPLLLTFIGDIMAHDVNYKQRDFSAMYANVSQYFIDDDLTFGNLEFPIDDSRQYSTYPRFNARSEYVQAVIDAGADVFSIANNHINDQGEEGILNTMASAEKLRAKYKKEREIYFSGLKKSAYHGLQPVVFEKKGFKIAFLAVTELLNDYNPKTGINKINLINEFPSPEFIARVRTLREETRGDLIVLSIHTREEEYVRGVSAERKEYFRALIDAGADIIWAHHPHVVQEWEIYKSGDSRVGLIMYSAGNFISGQRYKANLDNPAAYREYTGDALILKAAVTRNADGAIELGASPILLTTTVDPQTGEIALRVFDEQFISNLQNPWKEYYKKRYNLMKDQLGSLLPWSYAE